LVDNFQTASVAEAQQGILNDRFMTPARTKAAIDAMVGNVINQHISNYSNPHNVTKTQVGLGNIPNNITRSRGLNSDDYLLTAGGMFDHVNSADHDARYAPKNTAGVDCSVHWNGSAAYVWGGGAWRQVWPPLWQD
jgi:hypothetical protein